MNQTWSSSTYALLRFICSSRETVRVFVQGA